MNDFIQAAQNGNLIAAKHAFAAEMQTRIATAMDNTRREIGASVTIDGECVSDED